MQRHGFVSSQTQELIHMSHEFLLVGTGFSSFTPDLLWEYFGQCRPAEGGDMRCWGGKVDQTSTVVDIFAQIEGFAWLGYACP